MGIYIEAVRHMANDVARAIQAAEALGGESLVVMLSQALMQSDEHVDVASRLVSVLNEVVAGQIGREHGRWSAMHASLLAQGPFRFTGWQGAPTWCRAFAGKARLLTVSSASLTVAVVLDGVQGGGTSIDLQHWNAYSQTAQLYPEDRERFGRLAGDGASLPSAAEILRYTESLGRLTPHPEVPGEWCANTNLNMQLTPLRQCQRAVNEAADALAQSGVR